MPAQAIEIVSPSDVSKNEELLARVDRLIDTARQSQDILERTYLDIGIALKDVQESRAWVARFHSFDAYLREWCEPRFDRKRNQLYAYKTTAEQLLPHVEKQKLLEMGVTKATALSSYVKKTGKKPTTALLEAAGNPEVGIQEFRAGIAEAQHEKPETGKWYDFGGAFLSAEEREEIERGFQRATEIAPLPEDCPEWLKRKIQVQRLIAEFLSTYPCTENGQ